MVATTGVSVAEYLTSVYEPDCDYVDGEVVDRNVGEQDHSITQFLIGNALARAAQQVPIKIRPELRMRISPTRYRVPDLLVMRKTQHFERVLTSPPFLCIEIVSPEDRISRTTEKVKEYLKFGVEYVWVIDPQTQTAWQYTSGKTEVARDFLTTTNPDLSISLSELFTDMASEREVSD